MGLQKQYLKLGRRARDQLFGIIPQGGRPGIDGTPLSMLISQGVKFNNNRVAVMILGIITLIIGILFTSIPWLDYCILRNLRLWNNTLSFQYWQKPGVVRLTKVYIFNVTNPDGFLNGEKPKLVEVGPFVYRENMEKTNIQFHENFTVSYQHNKILQFVPELSVDKNQRIVTPNIPLLTLTSQSNYLGYFVARTISFLITAAKYKPFIELTAEELVFGYDDTLVSLAHKFYPRHKRPMSRMGLLVARNGTLPEVYTINTGHNGFQDFGYFDRINGQDRLPYWSDAPCTSIRASEGSLFPPRDLTKSDKIYIYDKDICRTLPFVYKGPIKKDGISADLYVLPRNAYDPIDNSTCFELDNEKTVKGLQNISPCQYGAPVYISNPHFYESDNDLLGEVDGLTPNKDNHESYFKIQPRLGVPLEGVVRVQLNLKVEHTSNVASVKDFRDFTFPIMWLEEGVTELTPAIRRWVYLATVLGPLAVPLISYGMIVSGAFLIIFVFVRAYKNFVFASDPAIEILEMGRRQIRRGSSFIAHHQHRIASHRDSYILLKENTSFIRPTTEGGGSGGGSDEDFPT